MRGEQFIDIIRDRIDSGDDEWLLTKFEVDSREGGMLILRKPNGGGVIDQPAAAVPPWKYEVGDEVMAAPVGGGEYFVVGPVMRSVLASIEFDAPFVGQSYHDANDATGAETLSTTSTANFQTARTLTTSGIPNGTYDVTVVGSGIFSHSGPGDVDLRVTCATAGVQSSPVSPPATTALVARLRAAATFGDVVVSAGQISVLFQYKANTAGTVNCRNAGVAFWAARTA